MTLVSRNAGIGGADKGNERQSERVIPNRFVAARTVRERRDEIDDTLAKVDRQTQDGAELDDDGEHLPIAVAEVHAEQCFGDAQVRGGTDGKKFG